jgi:phosphoenolpyruvate carboxykinase (ATP)
MRRCLIHAAHGQMPQPMMRRPQKLVGMFADNFAQYVPYIDEDVKAAAIS